MKDDNEEANGTRRMLWWALGITASLLVLGASAWATTVMGLIRENNASLRAAVESNLQYRIAVAQTLSVIETKLGAIEKWQEKVDAKLERALSPHP